MANERKTTLQASGRKTLFDGVKYAMGLVIRPEQMLELLHDAEKTCPIPFDAIVQGIGINDNGADSRIQFFYTSLISPLNNVIELNPHHFLEILKRVSEGLIPLDAELDGIEVSPIFTVLMLRIKSSRIPPTKGPNPPIAHLRYEAGQLQLVSPAYAIAKDEKRIQLSDKR
jgi:hypothetical protein